jgi:hypothetical protein
MTDTEWAALTPVQRNIAVAERVMGDPRCAGTWEPAPDCPRCLAPYSTQITQAWFVVERCWSLGISMWVGHAPNGPEKWVVQWKPVKQNTHYWAYGDTAAEAICRAALEAVEHCANPKPPALRLIPARGGVPKDVVGQPVIVEEPQP